MDDKTKLYATHAIAATGSIALGTGLAYPLDTIKTLIQVGSSSSRALTMNQVIKRIQSISGTSGLYGGFGWLALGRTFGLGTRFGVYEALTAYYKDGRVSNRVSRSEAFLAGFSSGVIESFVTSPFELIKLRAQVNSASGMPGGAFVAADKTVAPLTTKLLRNYRTDMRALNNSAALMSILPEKHPDIKGALKDYPWMISGSGRPPSVCDVRKARDVISLEGWGALWSGFRSGVVRDCIFGGVFFSCWLFLNDAMLTWKVLRMNPRPRSIKEISPLSPLYIAFAAGVSGSVAAAASHCFDTAKSRAQCTVLPKYVGLERKFLKWKRPGNIFERITGIHPADRNVLFRGLSSRMARSGLASLTVVGTYLFLISR